MSVGIKKDFELVLTKGDIIIQKFYWAPLSALFSFLSGFLGTVVGNAFAQILQIQRIEIFEKFLLEIAGAVGVLTYTIGVLLYRFVKVRNEKELVDYEYMQSRMRSLETQLNPHFLFNALNSIAELIHQDANKAEMAVLKVSAFLRNTMNEKPLLDLASEVKNVQDYVKLENIRFSGKIQLYIADTLPRWIVPKFSIQLIVENAIKHGFIGGTTPLNIFIEFDEASHIISIRNDGKAMKSRVFGVGLNNLNQRLELLCNGHVEIKKMSESTFYLYLGECCENNNR